MGKLVRLGLAVLLGVYFSLLMHNPSGWAGPPGDLELQGKPGGMYRRALASEPVTLDPAFVTDIYGRAVVHQVFDGLVEFDAHLNITPAIAEFWEASLDGRTWTFTLRRGVEFHNGREVVADDFVYSFTRLFDPKKPGPLAELLHRVEGAQAFMQGKATRVKGLNASGRYTFQIVLDEPYIPTLAILGLGNAAVVPREEVEKRGAAFARAPVGTGPFKFVRWEPGKQLVLEANESYYGGRPFLDGITFHIFPGGKLEAMFDAFLKGNLEETVIPSEKTDVVRTDPKYTRYALLRKPTLGFLYIGLNTRLKPFDDKRVRQAFNYGVHKEMIVREITKMGSLTAHGALPPGMPGHDPDLQGYYYSPDKAKRLLAEAGYPDGIGFPVVQLWSGSQAENTQAELAAYQRYLADLGVKVEIHYAANWPEYRSLLQQGKLPMFRLAWYADIPDADNTLSSLLHSAGASNYTFYRNPQVDQLLERARTELNYPERIALYRRVEGLVMEDAPWIAQHYPVSERLYQAYVEGVELSLLGDRAIPMRKIWLKRSPG